MSEQNNADARGKRHCPKCFSSAYEVWGIGISRIDTPFEDELDVPMVGVCPTCGHQDDLRPPEWRGIEMVPA